MSLKTDRPYLLREKLLDSEQAMASSVNNTTSIQMRILIELQVISKILREAYGVTEDMQQLRQDAADSIT